MTTNHLVARVDEFSYQVESEVDSRFWFRLIREVDRDVITDFTLGSFPNEQGGALAVQCYRVLGLIPNANLVFRNILSGRELNPELLRSAGNLYSSAGSYLFDEFDIRLMRWQVLTVEGKADLELWGEPHRSATARKPS